MWLRDVFSRRCAGLVAGMTLAMMVGALLALIGASSAAAAPGAPFSCPTETDFLLPDEGSGAQLYQAHAPSTTYSKLGSPTHETLNSLGYDAANNYLYATSRGPDLFQIDSTGTATALGAIAGAPFFEPSNGAFDGSNNYWISEAFGATVAYEVEVKGTPKVIRELHLSKPWEPADFTYYEGYMWGIFEGEISRLNLETGAVSSFTSPIPVNDYNANWTSADGTLGFSSDENGPIYKVSIANPSSAKPTFTEVNAYPSPLTGSFEDDGSSCLPPTQVDLAIRKTAPEKVAPGATINWLVTVTNNGPGTSAGFTIDDDVSGSITNVETTAPGCVVNGNEVTCTEGELPKGESFSVPLTGTAPSTYGTCVTNKATVTGKQRDPVETNNTATVQTCTETASISVVKSSPNKSYSSVGETIEYGFLVQNTGEATLSSISVADTEAPPASQANLSGPTCPEASLAGGHAERCTATYTVTQADLDNGSVSDTASASGTPPSGPAVNSGKSSLTVVAAQSPKLGLAKADNLKPAKYEKAAQVVKYTLTATNEGNVTLHNVKVSDAPELEGFSCTPSVPAANLAPGASIECTGTHTITQGDLDKGSFTDKASATSEQASAAPAQDTITANQTPRLGLTKTDNLKPASYEKVGQVVKYTLTATNEGNVTLHNVEVSDSPELEGFSCTPASPAANLAPGASIECTGAHTVTQADLDNGSFTDKASATSEQASAAPAEDTVLAQQRPKLGLTKTDNLKPASYEKVGQVVKYTLTATNEGNVTLHNVEVSDSPTLEGFSCTPSVPAASLAPGASIECTGTHTITQADLDNGSFTDVASATSKETSAPAAEDTITASRIDKLGLTKTDNLNPAKYEKVGQVVKYTLTAANEGNVTLHNVEVSDAPTLEGFSCTPSSPAASLAPGASVVCTGTHTITQADLDNGSFTDKASATSNETSAAPAEDTITANQVHKLGLTKTDNLKPASYEKVGQVVKYTLTAANEGNVTLHNVEVSDAPTLEGFSCTPSTPAASLAPGASVVCTGTHTITQGDLDNGSFTDKASATSKETSAAPAEDTITANQTRKLGLTKTDNLKPAKYEKVGQVVKYTLTATNEGNVTLHNVEVSDAPTLEGFSCTPSSPAASLAPGASVVCTGTHTITQGDLDNGSFTDKASASASGASATPAEDTITANQTRKLGLTKTDNLKPAQYEKVGQVVKYTLTATNEGNTTLHNVSVSDSPTLEGFSCTPPIPVASLAPGASVVCTGNHTITQADMENGSFKDKGTATSNEANAAPAEDTITGFACPSNPPNVNVRWHYTANGGSGGWSGTGPATCGKTITMGPQAMEGNLKVSPGATIKAGYDFTMPGNNKAFTVSFNMGKVVFAVHCVSGQTPSEPTFTITFPNQSYAATNSNWYPSGEQNSALVYQGSTPAPNLCASGTGSHELELEKGGTFSAFMALH